MCVLLFWEQTIVSEKPIHSHQDKETEAVIICPEVVSPFSVTQPKELTRLRERRTGLCLLRRFSKAYMISCDTSRRTLCMSRIPCEWSLALTRT